MDDEAYQAWRERLDAWLAGHPAEAVAAPKAPARATPLLAILAQARAVAAGLDAVCQGLALHDRNKYGFVAERMGDLINFDTFSLAEYSYQLADGSVPGVRLWHRAAEALVEVILFEDVVRWQVDELGKKRSHPLLALEVSGPEPAARVPESAGRYVRPGPWRRALADAMAAPVRIFSGQMAGKQT